MTPVRTTPNAPARRPLPGTSRAVAVTAARRPLPGTCRAVAVTAARRPLPGTCRAVAVTVLTALALLVGSAPAWAHTELESSTPAANAALPTAPSTVALTFSEDVAPDLATITVTGPDGQRYESGTPTGAGSTLNLALRPLGPAGPYTIDYRVVSDDGHPVEGVVPFSLTVPGPGAGASPAPAGPGSAAPAPPPGAASPSNTATSTADPGAPVWPWVAGAVVLALVGAGLALRRRRP